MGAEAKATHLMMSKVFSTCNLPISISKSKSKSFKLVPHHNSKIYAASFKKNIDSSQPQIVKKSSKIPRPLITVSPSDGRWHGNWNSEYVVSLKQLRLADLIEDDDHLHQHKNKDAQVSINLSIQKHASFGFSVDGRIITSFSRKCSYCSSPYCKKIDTTFNVWVLLSSRQNRNVQLPDIGGDPSVIYVKPGYQADLDSLVQDTIRLTTAVKDTCSETCENSEPTVQYIGAKNTASMAKRWGRLLELRNTQL